jgi:hypothetical protein
MSTLSHSGTSNSSRSPGPTVGTGQISSFEPPVLAKFQLGGPGLGH